MRTSIKTWLAVLACLAWVPLAGAEDEDPKAAEGSGEGGSEATETASSPQDQPILIASMPVFVPPNRGSPMARLGGATRSAGDELPRIEALVPERAGWTLEEQPTLYWYLSETTELGLELVVMQVEPHRVLLQAPLASPGQAGIQSIALADHGLRLEPGVSYQWLVKLVPRPDDRGYDRIVGGGIERVAVSEDLGARLAAPGASRPHALAEAGIWYDAVDELSRRIAADPEDSTLWNQRAALLEQVGLPALELAQGSAPGFGRK